ncbi:RNA polymerase sigma factor [Fredinandcohnia humi]
MANENEKKAIIVEWYILYGDSIFKFIAMMLKDHHKAEDLTHETFLKAFKYFDDFKNNSSAKTWLFTIARNVSIDYMRKRKPWDILSNIIPDVKNQQPLTDEILVIKEEKTNLYRALANLKDTYRQVIILRKIKEFSISETSIILGWSEGKVKSTLSRALRTLEQELVKEGFTDEKLS